MSARLDEYIYSRLRSALDGVASDDRKRAYVVSLRTTDVDEDPRKLTVTVGFNTEDDVAAAVHETDEGEARWNYACFGPHELAVLFHPGCDPDGAAVLQKVIKDAGYAFSADEEAAREITKLWFTANTVFAARRLHEAGDVIRIFGRSIPVLVHELEYFDVIAMQNMAANPPGVADDFVAWCRGL